MILAARREEGALGAGVSPGACVWLWLTELRSLSMKTLTFSPSILIWLRSLKAPRLSIEGSGPSPAPAGGEGGGLFPNRPPADPHPQLAGGEPRRRSSGREQNGQGHRSPRR